MTQLRKDQLKCPDCKESEDILVDSYVSNDYGEDGVETELECYCNKCKSYFCPHEYIKEVI